VERRLSLDVFRGFTVAAMILVNSPGNSTAFWPLEHADWHGLTPTDLIFPFFMLIVGMSLALSLSRKLEQGVSRESLIPGILKRTAILIALGILLSAFPYYDVTHWRFPGVLQRIGIGYGLGALAFLYMSRRWQMVTAALILVGYWLAMTQLSVLGTVPGDLSRDGNLAAAIDRWVFGVHLYKPTFDPEGLLSTLPAIVSVLMGIWVARWQRVRPFVIGGFAALAAGLVWSLIFPLNKALWSSSYVLVTGGLAYWTYALLIWLVDQKGYSKWGIPFIALGQNAIAAYLLHIGFLKIQNRIPITLSDGMKTNLRLWLTDHALFAGLSSEMASLAYAFCYTLLWMLFFYWLYRRRITIRI